jgi:anhydro-N-acetylmuramic acid kinase
MNVVDAFPGRDVARGGQGGPLAAVAEWLLLRSPRRNRLLVDLGRTLRMTWMPKTAPGRSLPGLLSFDVGPGMRLLDLLAERLTGGEHRFDPGGRLAVQGRRIGELIDRWLTEPYFRRSLPRWHPRGVRAERFLLDALQLAVRHEWSVRDLLCTATHFVAELVPWTIRHRLPQDAAVEEVVLSGGGQQNGMLLREIAARLPDAPVARIHEHGIASEALGPACAGLLAFFHLDQVPANGPEVTGTEVARVLGRLTPGSPQSWQRLLTEMSGSKPAVRPLRSAL